MTLNVTLFHGRVGSAVEELTIETAYESNLLGGKCIFLADTQRAAELYARPDFLENKQKGRVGESSVFSVNVQFHRLAVLTEEECSDLTQADLDKLKARLSHENMDYLIQNPHLMGLHEVLGTDLIEALSICGFDALKHDSNLVPFLAATMQEHEFSYAVFEQSCIKSVCRI